MNFSFELSGAMLTGNISPETMGGLKNLMISTFGGLVIVGSIIYLAIIVFMIIARWKLFKKAGFPGWAILIPGYNRVLMFKLGKLSGRWATSIISAIVFGIIGMIHLHPIRRVLSTISAIIFAIIMIVNYFKIPPLFGKHWTFGFGILFLKIIFIPILAFDDSKYLGKKSISKPTIAAKPIVKLVTKTPIKVSSPTKKIITKKSITKKAVAKKITKKK